MSVLSEPHFHNEEAAVARLEAIVWPDGPVCPHCGGLRNTQIKGKTARPGLRSCTDCRQQFRVTVGTIFERSHVPLHKWFQAAHLMASSKKGLSAHQLHRTLKVTYKTAWFMEHRLREAMRDGTLAPMGGEGRVAEADETYFGRKPGFKKNRGPGHKMAILKQPNLPLAGGGSNGDDKDKKGPAGRQGSVEAVSSEGAGIGDRPKDFGSF